MLANLRCNSTPYVIIHATINKEKPVALAVHEFIVNKYTRQFPSVQVI